MAKTKNIRQRKDGKYEGRIVINGERISVYGDTKLEAQSKLKRLKENAENQGLVKKSDTLASTMGYWLENVKRITKIKASTYERAYSTFKQHILTSNIAKKRIDRIEANDFQRLLNDKVEEGYSYSSIKKIYDLLREFYRYQVEMGKLNRNPMKLVYMPMNAPEPEIDYLTDEERKKVIEIANMKKEDGSPYYRYGAAITLLLRTGMRNGELRALTIDSVDLDNRLLHITQAITKQKDRRTGRSVQLPSTTKTEKKRDINLTDKTVEAIKVLLETTANKKTGYLITTEKGNILTHALLQRAYDRILKKAGVEHKGLHSTRHTFGTHGRKKAESKGKIKELSTIMGHSRISTTYDYYIGSSSEDRAELMNEFDEEF